jgi:hypothetical protein
MSLRTAAALLLFVTGSPSGQSQTKPPAPHPTPPSQFSPSYSEALSGSADLDQTGAALLEKQLAANPRDLQARLKLMAYHRRADRAGSRADRAKRLSHAQWLIEHDPGSELLHSFVSRFSSDELSSSERQQAAALWTAACQAHPGDADVQWNAASFFEGLDPELHLHYLEATAAADPNHPHALRPLAHLYALSLLESHGAMASRAQAGLEASKNVWVLGNAAYMLQSQYILSVQRGAPNRRAAGLAERYFLRAKALDPKLDRQTILPKLDLQSMARAKQDELRAQQESQARFDEAARRIQRLPVAAFPKLPPAVARVLTARKCMAPQPSLEGGPHNVIRGEFFMAGQAGWAALCSAGNSTTLLVFRHDRDANPETVATGEDRNHLQGMGGDRIEYSRLITAVGRDFILRHYRAYGGLAPPPIDHQGIDDAFLGKASVTWYFHRGKWLGLQGAD